MKKSSKLRPGTTLSSFDAYERSIGEIPSKAEDEFELPDIFEPTNGPFTEKVGDLKKPVLNDRTILKIVTSDGEVLALSRSDFSKLVNNDKDILTNGRIIDPILNRITTYDSEGFSNDSFQVDKDEYSKYPFTSDTDIYGNFTINNEVVQEEVIKPDKNKKALSFNDLISIVNAPVVYHNNIKRKISYIDSLVSCLSINSGQFDEIFTIEEIGPESPLLKKYINILADLVNKEIGESDEIDDIETLEQLAYDAVGYVGKTIEIVKNEAKDFKDYFRFLLIKKDKKVITIEEHEYAKIVAPIIKDRTSFNKRCKLNKEIIFDENTYSNEFYFYDIVDSVIDGDEIFVRFYKYTSDILTIAKQIELDNLDIRIGLVYEGLNKTYNSLGKSMYFSIVAYDKDYNCKFIDIKSSTLSKYKKKFNDVIINFDKTFKESRSTLIPRELRNFNSI